MNAVRMLEAPGLPAGISVRSRTSALSDLSRRAFFLLTICCFLLAGSLAAQESVSLVGAGSTVPQPLYARFSQEFNKANHGVQMQYQAMGTAEGIKLVSGGKDELGKADFGAGEAQLTEEQRAAGNLMELPVVMIAIVPIYNLPSVHQDIHLNGDVLAQIFLGHIKNWNAPAVAKLNPGVTFPDLPIKVVYRPGGKGSNFVFSDFLSKTSAVFREQLGRSASPKWPVGAPAERSSDMVEKVKGEAGAIGYVELGYASKAGLKYALVQNPAGKFVKASNLSITAACHGVEAPQWNKFSASLTNAPGADSFPIVSFSWVYLRESSSDPRRRGALLSLLNWMFANGQQIATEQGYAPLPPALLAKVKEKVKSLH